MVVIDLTRIRLDSRDAVSTAKGTLWSALSETPAGADVRLVVPRWDWWAPFAAEALLDLGQHIGTVTVESDAATVRRWVLALRQEIRAFDSVMDQ